jgi:hypothetical protein
MIKELLECVRDLNQGSLHSLPKATRVEIARDLTEHVTTVIMAATNIANENIVTRQRERRQASGELELSEITQRVDTK